MRRVDRDGEPRGVVVIEGRSHDCLEASDAGKIDNDRERGLGPKPVAAPVEQPTLADLRKYVVITEFSALPPEEQTPILREHGKIGHAFGEAGYAHDIRLACFGLDKNDNDFVIGLVGAELYPLSACVQAMRKTKQTSLYIEQMGPFFIGKAIWQTQL